MINLEKVTENVYTLTTRRGCDPSIVFTSEGSVFIDTAQLLSDQMEMLEFAKAHGPIKYLINTEAHIDHIFGNHYFAGVCPVVGHAKMKETFFLVPHEPVDLGDGYDYSIDVLRRQDPEALKFVPSRENYIQNKPQIEFNDQMTLYVGDHTFHLYHTPGHSDCQIAVYCPEERVVFVGDTIFSGCQMWLHTADIDALIKTYDFLYTLDVDYIIPGHGPVVTKDYIVKQKTLVYDWLSAVGTGMSKGWTLDECIRNISFADRFPVDIGQSEMMDYIQKYNVVKCYNYLLNKK